MYVKDIIVAVPNITYLHLQAEVISMTLWSFYWGSAHWVRGSVGLSTSVRT